MNIKEARCLPLMKKGVGDWLAYTGPCALVSCSVSGVGANAKVILCDGTNANGEGKITLQAPNTYSYSPNLSEPVLFEKGLFVDSAAATDDTTVCILPVDLLVEGGVETKE